MASVHATLFLLFDGPRGDFSRDDPDVYKVVEINPADPNGAIRVYGNDGHELFALNGQGDAKQDEIVAALVESFGISEKTAAQVGMRTVQASLALVMTKAGATRVEVEALLAGGSGHVCDREGHGLH